ncbi:MAG: orotidine-5'-phosphate decarboxylase [Candidatus Limnocylindria bacterium]
MTPLERLRARRARIGAPLCLGIDPHPDQLPSGFNPDVAGIERFARGVIEAAVEHCVAVKINVAFFEAFGADGARALARVRGDVPRDLICILDAKRGDIGSTAERYAAALFGELDADAVTLSPYLGEDALAPFLEFEDRLLYVLVRTSNPSAPRIQDLDVGGRPLYRIVGGWLSDTWTDGRVGLVVGATATSELEELRSDLPEPAFLVPGVGAQGGDLVAAARACDGRRAPGLVTASRAIAGASRADDWADAARVAAEDLRRRMAEAVLPSGATADSRHILGGS